MMMCYHSRFSRTNRKRNLKQAASIMKKMLRKWVANGNPNISQFMMLYEAEVASLKSPDSAAALFESAINVATRAGFRHDKALIHARAARFHYVVKKDIHWGSYHIDKAIQAYTDWGAIGVARHLTRKYLSGRDNFSAEIEMSGSTREMYESGHWRCRSED